MKYWIGAVCEEHAQRGVHAGIVQIGHGKRTNLARMQQGEGYLLFC